MDTRSVNYIENHYLTFSGLRFSRVLQFQSLKDAKREFYNVIKSISNRPLKTNPNDKALIIWARSVKKHNLDFFDDPAVKVHFYAIHRRSLLYSKKLIEAQDEIHFVSDQLAEDQNPHEEADEEAYEETRQTTNEEANEDTYEEKRQATDEEAKENTYDEAQQATKDIHEETRQETSEEAHETYEQNEQEGNEATENYLDIPPSGAFKSKFEGNFRRMKADEKWYLSNGTCVEDELFAFGMQCTEEHPSHSFIVDPTDTNYQRYKVFTDDELQEIKTFREKRLPVIPTKLRDYLNSYNLPTTAALRQKIFTSEEFDQEHAQDMDWVRFTVYALVREYESGSLKRSHSEEWYKAHVWHFLDTVFDSMSEIEVLRGERASFSSGKRKNKDRSIGAIEPLVSKKIGSKCDMIFRKLACNHDNILEFGATETGKDYDGDDATKRLIEGCIKLPKCLKDMLDNLAVNIPAKADIEVVGFIHSGLQSCLVRADRPTAYTTRITRAPSVHINSDISQFGPTVLPAMYSAWFAREIVKRVLRLAPTFPTPISNADSSWLDTYWVSSPLPVIPETSTSLATNRSSKKTKITH